LRPLASQASDRLVCLVESRRSFPSPFRYSQAILGPYWVHLNLSFHCMLCAARSSKAILRTERICSRVDKGSSLSRSSSSRHCSLESDAEIGSRRTRSPSSPRRWARPCQVGLWRFGPDACFVTRVKVVARVGPRLNFWDGNMFVSSSADVAWCLRHLSAMPPGGRQSWGLISIVG
jgi:hypothetical protein